MKSFKQFVETKLPKSADLYTVRNDNWASAEDLPKLSKKEIASWTDYINTLNDWVGESANAEWLWMQRKNLPKVLRKGGNLFRGFGLNLEFDDRIDDWTWILRNDKVVMQGYGSWSRKLSIAKKFIYNDMYDNSNHVGFMVKTKIPDANVVVDVYAFITDRKIVEIGAVTTTEDFFQIELGRFEREVIVKDKGKIDLAKDFMVGQVEGKVFTNYEKWKKAAIALMTLEGHM